jgi:hypothetical protein
VYILNTYLLIFYLFILQSIKNQFSTHTLTAWKSDPQQAFHANEKKKKETMMSKNQTDLCRFLHRLVTSLLQMLQSELMTPCLRVLHLPKKQITHVNKFYFNWSMVWLSTYSLDIVYLNRFKAGRQFPDSHNGNRECRKLILTVTETHNSCLRFPRMLSSTAVPTFLAFLR